MLALTKMEYPKHINYNTTFKDAHNIAVTAVSEYQKKEINSLRV
jgi:hypothetical protein